MLKQVTERNKAATKQGKLHLQIGDCCDLPYDDDLADTKKGFKKFEPEQLVAIGKQADFDNIQVKDIAKGKVL